MEPVRKSAVKKLGALDCDDIEDGVKEESPVSVCMIGTGEYTTGYVHGMASDSDKGAGGGWVLMHCCNSCEVNTQKIRAHCFEPRTSAACCRLETFYIEQE